MAVSGYPFAERLHHPDPRARVEALRILAMVEETRARPVVEWIAAHDPVEGVREVATWAADVLRAAEARGHSTQRAIEAMFTRALDDDEETRFLSGITFAPATAKRRQRMAYEGLSLEQQYERELHAVLSPGGEADDAAPLLPAGDAALPAIHSLEDFAALLDAGLTHLRVEDHNA